MKQVFRKPGFWMMILFIVLVAIIMYAPSGECAEANRVPGVRYMVELEKITSDWGVGIDFRPIYPLIGHENKTEKILYHHYIQAAGHKPVKVFTTETPPNRFTMIKALQIWQVRMNKGGK